MHLIYIVSGTAFVHFPSECLSTNILNWFPCCPAETRYRESTSSKTKTVWENEYSIIYAPLTNFMMPLGGHGVVLCLLLLAVVHRGILMDTSKNEVSS